MVCQYTKEYNRTTASAKNANTRAVIKSDEELKETAKTAANRIKQAVETLTKYGQKYDLCLEQLARGEWAYDTKEGETINVTVEQHILNSCLSREIALSRNKNGRNKNGRKRKNGKRPKGLNCLPGLQKLLQTVKCRL